MINIDNATNENERDSFAHGRLKMANGEHNDEFFNHIVKKITALDTQQQWHPCIGMQCPKLKI